MTMHAPPIEAPTPGELAIAAGTSQHGVAALTVTVHGEVMAVCVCSLVGYGVDDVAARADLAAQHQEAG
jgi:hypothetical protein